MSGRTRTAEVITFTLVILNNFEFKCIHDKQLVDRKKEYKFADRYVESKKVCDVFPKTKLNIIFIFIPYLLHFCSGALSRQIINGRGRFI